MSLNPVSDDAPETALKPWDAPVIYRHTGLQLSVKIPADWTVEETPEYPLQFIAPARGQTPFQVYINLLIRPAPPMGNGLFPFAAEQIFSEVNNPTLPEFKAQDSISISLYGFPAILQRSSWQQQDKNGQIELRQTVLVTQAWDRLFIYRLVMTAELTDMAMQAFMALTHSLTILEPEPESAVSSGETVKEVAAKQRQAQAETTAPVREEPKFTGGRWSSRRRDS